VLALIAPESRIQLVFDRACAIDLATKELERACSKPCDLH